MARWLYVLAACVLLAARTDATFFLTDLAGLRVFLTGSIEIDFSRFGLIRVDAPLRFRPGDAVVQNAMSAQQQPFVQQPQVVQQQFVQPQPATAALPLRQEQSQRFPFISCSSSTIQATGEGKGYHFSWCHTNQLFTRDQAVGYCRRLGRNINLVSMETPDQDGFVSSVVDTHLDFPNPWIWSSGRRVHGLGGAQDSWVWETARGDVPHTVYNNWSHTGGNNLPQPDNREGNENFLAVLKNVYNDGVRWHDIAEHHTKHVICEGRPKDFTF